MLNDDEWLGAALAERLRDLVSDIEPSPALIATVDRELAAPGASRRRNLSGRLRSRLIALSIATAAAIVAAIITLGGSTVTPSFAVTRSPDGTILVTIRQIAGVTGADTRLRELGAPVTVVPITNSCQAQVELTYMALGGDHATTIRVIPAEIPPNTTVVLAAQQVSNSRIEMAVGRVTGSPPACVAPGTTGPGVSSLPLPPTSSVSSPTTATGNS